MVLTIDVKYMTTVNSNPADFQDKMKKCHFLKSIPINIKYSMEGMVVDYSMF